jgi:glucose/arabinose dehydrogenase
MGIGDQTLLEFAATRPSDLPVPYASPSRANEVAVVEKPANARLKVPLGFEVIFANGLDEPRLIRVAPNGDIFVAESVAGRIRVLRPADGGDGVSRNEIFVSGLKLPFGIAFYPRGNDPQWVYVANTDSVVRFPYRNGDLRTTRQWMAVLRRWIEQMVYGAASHDETERAVVLVFDPEGKGRRIYASAGIRNCVAMAVNSATGDLWCSTNERDGLGDDLPPDYITPVREGGFYGWPWYYIGAHEDQRHKGARPDLEDKVIVPDILIQPHSASMQMMFHTGRQFPAEYKGNIFAAEHGSWNRAKPTGYKIIRIAVKDGVPTGEYEDFVTGFAIDDARVWGRPVGVAEAADGSLLFSEDGNGTIWRLTSKGRTSVQ